MSDDRPFHNPFEVLKSLKRPEAPADAGTESTPDPRAPTRTPAPPATPAVVSRSSSSPPGAALPIARAVVRMERAGRGGKEVTVVEHMNLPPPERERWLKALKSQLGCGGVVEGESLVLQGDHRKRLPAILAARGVKKVTVG